MIEVKNESGDEYEVAIGEEGSLSKHRVTLTDQYHQKLSGGKESKEELLKRSFEFLLKREPKESILPKFDLPVIGRYFPEYEKTIRR